MKQSVILNTSAEYGRIKIFCDVDEVTEANVLEIFSTAYSFHQKNALKEEELFLYERGDQPILSRVKDIRSEINEKVLENTASAIVDVHVGYCFGNPITYVQRGSTEADRRKPVTTAKEDNIRIAMLNKMMAEQGKAYRDVELARDFMICGLGYQMAWKNDNPRQYSPFKITTLNPVTTFVVYKNDAWRKALLACTYFMHADGSLTATCYSEKLCFTIRNFCSPSSGDTLPSVDVTPNVLGIIPIVEFENVDRMGVFEKVIPLLNELNIINSDRVNDISQHVQSLLWMHNCQLDDEKKKQLVDGNGIVATKSNGDGKEAKIQYLNQVLDQSGIQSLVDYLERRVEVITSTPSWQEASGGSTTGAMQLSNGWQSLELSAKSVEQKFTEPENMLLDVVSRIIDADKKRGSDFENMDISDIMPHFTRNKNYDLLAKTNALATLINTGVDGLVAFETVGLFPDAEQAYVDSAATIERVQRSLGQQKETNANKDENGKGGENNEEKPKVAESIDPSKAAQVED